MSTKPLLETYVHDEMGWIEKFGSYTEISGMYIKMFRSCLTYFVKHGIVITNTHYTYKIISMVGTAVVEMSS